MAQQQPMPAQEQPGQKQAEGGNDLMDLVKNIGMGLSMFNEALSEVNPELGKEGAALEAGFQALIEKLSQGGQQKADSRIAPQMQGSKGVPMNPGSMR